MWVPKLLLPFVKTRIFVPKRPNLAQNMLSWAHIGLASSFVALLFGGCGAQAVSRKTTIYVICLYIPKLAIFVNKIMLFTFMFL